MEINDLSLMPKEFLSFSSNFMSTETKGRIGRHKGETNLLRAFCGLQNYFARKNLDEVIDQRLKEQLKDIFWNKFSSLLRKHPLECHA